jgi:2-polyprenyl-6-methoxyphenol hydroxylase-like FAD-dependent oxidoreductase
MPLFGDNVMRVLISGAGMAGLTLAYWLKRYGFVPTIIERHPALRTEGYKLDIRGAAVEVLHRMGVRDEVYAARTQIQRALYVNHAGKIVSESSPDLCGVRSEGDLEIVRADLCAILARAMGDVECLFGNSIRNLTQTNRDVHVEFEDGSKRNFDLIVGADGLHSRVRELAFGPEAEFLHRLGLYVSFYSIPNYLHLDRVEIEYHSGPKFAIAYCPQGGIAKAGFAFASQGDDDNLRERSGQEHYLAQAFAGSSWEIPTLLEHMPNSPDFYFDCMAQVRMPHWTKGRAALVGDAGYAVSPIAGQGTSVALVGAYVLAGELAAAEGEFTLGFANYENALRDFVAQNQALAKMSETLIGAGSNSWRSRAVLWLNEQLTRWLPTRWIHYCKSLGLKRTHAAANAISLKDYEQPPAPEPLRYTAYVAKRIA